MESTVPTPAIDQLKTIEFKVGLRGFAVAEVDDFLDQVAAEVDILRDHYREQHAQLNQQLRRASERIKQLEEQSGTSAPSPAAPAAPSISAAPAPAPAPTPTATTHGVDQAASLLAMTQEFIDKAKSTASAEAAALVARAKEEARAHLEESKSRALDEVTQLEGKKRRLTEDIATLDRFINAERERFRTILGEVGTWIETKFAVRESSAPTAPSAPVVRASEPEPTPRPNAGATPGEVTTIGQALNLSDNDE